MKNNLRLLYWGVPVVIALLFGVFLYAIFTSADDYPIGYGRHEDSPDGLYLAEASNMRYPEDKEDAWYYEFKITQKSDSRLIAEFRNHDEAQNIQFRQGSGRIYWANDSRSVRFGDSTATLWEYTIPKKKRTNKAEMATPRKLSD